jgi:RHS repeat-associated protein
MKSTGKLYWYGAGGEVLLEGDPAQTYVYDEHIYFNGQRIARRSQFTQTNSSVYYFFSDHLGSSRIVTDSTGAVKEDSDFYPFGGERVVIDTLSNNYKFTGQERDGESGLDYFIARHYAFTLARFLQPDPLRSSGFPSNPQSWNRYAYTLNNPAKYIDQNGKCAAPAGGTGACIGIYLKPSTFSPTKSGVSLSPLKAGGDGRGPAANNPNATSRGEVRLSYDKKSETLTVTGQKAAESTVSVGPVSASAQGAVTASVAKSVNENGDVSFSVTVQATNGFAAAGLPGAPDPADAVLNFTATQDGLEFTGGTADPFFDLEAFTYENGNPQQVVDQQGTYELNDLKKMKPIEPVKPQEPIEKRP